MYVHVVCVCSTIDDASASSATADFAVTFCVICSMALHWPNRFIIIILSLLFCTKPFRFVCFLVFSFFFCSSSSAGGGDGKEVVDHVTHRSHHNSLTMFLSAHKILIIAVGWLCDATLEKHFSIRCSRGNRSNRTKCMTFVWPFRICAPSPPQPYGMSMKIASFTDRVIWRAGVCVCVWKRERSFVWAPQPRCRTEKCGQSLPCNGLETQTNRFGGLHREKSTHTH